MRLILSGLRQFETITASLPDPSPDSRVSCLDVVCCAICRTDAKMWEQGHRDLVFPRVLGHEMVVRDQAGSLYAVWPGNSCGQCRFCKSGMENLCDEMKITGFHTDGGFSDRVALPHQSLIPLPDGTDPVIACFAEPVACVMNAFEKLDAHSGQRMLIYGAGTMGLITAFYARNKGIDVHLLEKNQAKLDRVSALVSRFHVTCSKDIPESEYDIVINCCADFIAFCQAITKVDKAGQISFFSGITKNEQIETNLLNLLHYKEVKLTGVYGMTRSHMSAAVDFIARQGHELRRFIEDVVPLDRAPELMERVLSGEHLKYVIDPALPPYHDSPGKSGAVASITPNSGNTGIVSDGILAATLQNITPLSPSIQSEATAKMDEKTKPLGALGRLEPLGIRMSMIQNRLDPKIRQKNLFVFAGDHGITEEGVSAYPSEVTGQMVKNFLNGGAAINVLCRHHGIELSIVDMGVKTRLPDHPALIKKKIAQGTKNFALEPAMTKHQAVQALESGIAVFKDTHAAKPIDIVGLGEMGIGNTTSASAIICAITGISPEQAAGRGTGIDDAGLAHKIKVLRKVLHFHQPDPTDGMDILTKIGGFEIAGIAGAVLAAAEHGTAVVLDGVISTAAGLLAFTINPDVQGYLVAGHKSVEISQMAALTHMGLDPLIDFGMRLGEGTGAALAIDMADAACKIMCDMASFDEAKIARSTLSARMAD